MSDPFVTNRRCFVKAVASAGAGLALGLRLPLEAAAAAPAADATGAFAPNAFLRIEPGGRILVTMTRTEIGQGVRTALPMILAEELEADWRSIELVQASPGPPFRSLGTGGSWSVGGHWAPLRQAGAAAREMLLTAAAARWGVDRAECRAEAGAVVHAPSGRRAGYGELAADAAKLPVPERPPLKDPKDFRIVGRRMKRIDGPAIVTGRAPFGIDARVPGARAAVVARCPVLGGKLKDFDAAKAKRMPGVRAVLPISTGVAVVADTAWAALRGREALELSWDEGPNAGFDSEAFLARLAEASREPGVVTRLDGQGLKAAAGAARALEATYLFPFQAHATLEPMNCVADARGGRCELWVPTQAPDRVRDRVAARLGIDPGAVAVNVTAAGGGFGRRLGFDYAVEAAELARAAGEPVHLLWSREDDMRHGHFQPASAHRMAGALDARGNPVAWGHAKAGSHLSIFGPPSPEELRDPAYFRDASWGAYDVPYAIPSVETSYVWVDSPVPSGPWRAVYAPSCVFARECFLDEMAHAAGRDPLELRLALLADERPLQAGNLRIDRGRLRRVLEVAAERAGWGRPLPAGVARGVACSMYEGETCVAYVAEVSAGGDGAPRVLRIVAAVDCGLVVNPSGVEAQIEGGIAFGLSAALCGQITFRRGRAEQSTYRDYPVLRMREMPAVEIHLVPSGSSPFGMGEPPVPPVAPAVLNALFAATGRRVRRLPVSAGTTR